MRIEFQPDGILLTEIGLWLDPGAGVGAVAAWISHGHSDHARGVHGCVWATPETLEFYRARWPEAGPDLRGVPYGASFEHRGARCTVLPAGHILGAAQLLVEYCGERVVYTGDIKLREPLCGEPTRIAPCDRLIIECTFGLPIYHFLSREEAAERISTFARQCLDDGATPVFYGYPLGRGQEISHVLGAAGIPVSVHGAIARFIPHYERAGYQFGDWEPYRAERTRGRALVVTPSMRGLIEASEKDFRVAYVSGWAALANARARVGAEELIAYSDHAGFGELLDMIGQSGASQVDLVHGYVEPFAHILRQRGINAVAAAAGKAAGETAASAGEDE